MDQHVERQRLREDHARPLGLLHRALAEQEVAHEAHAVGQQPYEQERERHARERARHARAGERVAEARERGRGGAGERRRERGGGERPRQPAPGRVEEARQPQRP